jgi:hypothetical protein
VIVAVEKDKFGARNYFIGVIIQMTIVPGDKTAGPNSSFFTPTQYPGLQVNCNAPK